VDAVTASTLDDIHRLVGMCEYLGPVRTFSARLGVGSNSEARRQAERLAFAVVKFDSTEFGANALGKVPDAL